MIVDTMLVASKCYCGLRAYVATSSSRKSARLVTMHQGLNSPGSSHNSFFMPPPHDPPPPPMNLASNQHNPGLLQLEPFLQITNNKPTDFLSGCQSSLEGNTSKNVEDKGSIEGGELEDLLRWPSKLFIVPERRRKWRCNNSRVGTLSSTDTEAQVRDGKGRETGRVRGAKGVCGNKLSKRRLDWAGQPGCEEGNELGRRSGWVDPMEGREGTRLEMAGGCAGDHKGGAGSNIQKERVGGEGVESQAWILWSAIWTGLMT
jgi:hypothetical protein